MKNIATIVFFGLGIFFSCGNTVEKPDKQEINKEKENNLLESNIDLLSDTELILLMNNIEEKLIDNESLEVSKKYSIKLLETSKKHIEKFPKSQERREVIRKASKAAQGLNQDYEAIRLLEMSIAENSNDTTIVEEMNVRAFLFDKIDDKEKAREAYTEIIDKFPSHPLTKMHKARLKTLHMNEEEFNEWLKEQNAK